ncbi:MAG: tetratricopeptide repeat protein [Candidatus Obscuribacter sp.]|nr:tetratricopeptide repeat protein [Candidatus Obscuribacter sp.]MBP6349710.1 tetratricopeptide repeat protein [Candidatus Obscuribacter sp.]
MTWKELAASAMKALMNGDNATAVTNWKASIALIEKNQEQGTAEIAQIYYYLGKCLADDGDLIDGIEAMSQAEAIFSEVEPGHATVKELKYHLGAALNKVGDHGAADSRLRSAMGIVDAPLAKGLIRQKNSNLTIKEMIKVLKNTGLVNELSPALLKTIARTIEEEGRGEADDIDNFHPFDVLYYYWSEANRFKQDRAMLVECFDAQTDLPILTEALNDLLEQSIVNEEDLTAVGTEENSVPYIIIDSDEDGPVGTPVRDFWNLIKIYNTKLHLADDQNRVIRLAGYSERDAVIILSKAVAAKIYNDGAGAIFENLTEDLEPEAPKSFRLS